MRFCPLHAHIELELDVPGEQHQGYLSGTFGLDWRCVVGALRPNQEQEGRLTAEVPSSRVRKPLQTGSVPHSRIGNLHPLLSHCVRGPSPAVSGNRARLAVQRITSSLSGDEWIHLIICKETPVLRCFETQ